MENNNNLNGFDSFENANKPSAEENVEKTNSDPGVVPPVNDTPQSGSEAAQSTGSSFKNTGNVPPVQNPYTSASMNNSANANGHGPANSYTPNANKFVQGGGYGNYYAYQQTPPMYNQPPKNSKNKKYGLGAVIATALACSIIGSGATTAVVLAINGSNISSSEQQQIVKTINVEETASNLVQAISEKCMDSVVGIRTTLSYNQFFGSQEATGEGSGVIYSADGYIITNYHVISDTSSGMPTTISKIEVYLNNVDDPYEAELIGYNKSCDLAVLKINAAGLSPMEFGNSDELKVGETAVAIGSPGGLDFINSVSSGVVSGVNRSITVENIGTMTLIQTDAAINPGNSGGALVNSDGKLIGINNVKIASSDYENMGFAIPSNTVGKVVKDLIENQGTSQKLPYLGLQIYSNYTSESLKKMGYPSGAVIGQIVSGGPCDGIGLQQYDIITEFNGNKLSSYEDLETYKNQCNPGDKVEMKIYRYSDKKYYTVTVTLGEATN